MGTLLTGTTTASVLVFVEVDGSVRAQVEGIPVPVWSLIPLSFGPP